MRTSRKLFSSGNHGCSKTDAKKTTWLSLKHQLELDKMLLGKCLEQDQEQSYYPNYSDP